MSSFHSHLFCLYRCTLWITAAESGAGCGQAFDWQLRQQKDLNLSEVVAAAESDLGSQTYFMFQCVPEMIFGDSDGRFSDLLLSDRIEGIT